MSVDYFGPKWGGTTFGTPGGSVTWSFAAGAGSIYAFDATITESAYRAAVRTAFSDWEHIANIDFVEVSDSNSSDIRLGWDALDGFNGTLGYTTMQYSGATATHSEVAFDTAETWTASLEPPATSTSFYSVAIHEIGHAIGLGHSDDTSSIMYPYLQNLREPGAVDVLAIQALYGPSLLDRSATGTDGSDTMIGGGGADTLSGGAGADSIDGQDGADVLFGGIGSDIIYGRGGNDVLFGGQGEDADRIFAGAGTDQAYGGGGDDTITGDDGNDVLGGGAGADSLSGGVGNDAIFGGAGNFADQIDGDAGADRIFAGDGNDTVFGAEGDDEIGGGAGADLVIAGPGNDVIYLGAHDGAADVYQSVPSNGNDTVYGFDNGIDHLDLRSSGFFDFAQIQAVLGSDSDGDATITLASGQILTLEGVSASDVDASDFVF